jgi:photosystem II stability/assembly factor-like uncharacterized protein
MIGDIWGKKVYSFVKSHLFFLLIRNNTKMTEILKIKFWSKSAVTIFCVLLFMQIVSAQAGWQEIRRGGSGDLVSVFFTSSEKGWVGGDDGYLAMTDDGGKNWTRQILNSKDNINEIYFRNDDNGYILAGSRIYLTKNGGKVWRENVVVSAKDYKGLIPEFLSVRFTDKRRGWIVGSLSNQKEEVVDSLILQTIDGGETWSRIVTSHKQELFHLDFANNSEGWIVGDRGLVLVTRDGGLSWERQPTGTTLSLFNIDFRDSKNGVIVGSAGMILRTENGGLNWERVRTPETKSFMRINFLDDNAAWVVGVGGTILRTDDKGKTWIKQASQTTESLYGLFIDKKGGWAVGKKGLVLRYVK